MTKLERKIRLEELDEQMKNCELIKNNAKVQAAMSTVMIIMSLFVLFSSLCLIFS